ncbi:MAG: sigma-70 family RNA polymerase sigma factor [Gammaproteobacteria bacterium]|nr:sigma-70 family RNA polymerase sigma factor [Gammaproteobacteria bacterium]
MRTQLFNQYILQHSSGAFAMALQMLRSREEAKDVMQDACCALLRQARLPEDSQQFRMLLYKVVRNKAIDRLRALKVRQSDSFAEHEETLALPVSFSDGGGNPEAQIQLQQQMTLLKTALSQLSAEHRDILLLKDWQGFSYAEIAEILDIEPGTVMSRLHRARLAIREQMARLDEDCE